MEIYDGSKKTRLKAKTRSARPGVGNARRGMEFNCSRAPCCSQSANRSVPSFRAFENLARDVPARLMFFVADR